MERKQWIDTLRGICMTAILLFHTEMYYSGDYIIPYGCYVHNALATFFFVSGYLFCGNSRDGREFDFARKIRSVFKTLIVPYFIFTTVIGTIKIVANHAESTEILHNIILGKASWFVAALIVAELLLAVTMFITRGKTVLLSITALLSFITAFVIGNKHNPSPLFNEQNSWYVNDAFLAMGIMICGIFYRRHEDFFNRFNTILYTSLLFILLLIIKNIIIIYQINTVLGSIEVSNIPMFLTDIGIAILFLVNLSKLINKLPLISWTGAHSLVYYFFCGAVPATVTFLFNKIGFQYSHYWQIIVMLTAVYFICTAIAFTIYRYTPFLVGRTKKNYFLPLIMMLITATGT